MSTFKNVYSGGDLEVPALRAVVRAGETVEVSDEVHASSFRSQSSVWEELLSAAAEVTVKGGVS